MKNLGIELMDQYEDGNHVFQDSEGKLFEYKDYKAYNPYQPIDNLLDKLQKMARNLSDEGYSKGKWKKEEKEMDEISFHEWLSQNAESPNESNMLSVMMNTAMGSEPEEYSLLYFLMILKSCVGFKEIMDVKDCAQQWKTVEGAQEISKKLERWINLHRGGKVIKGSVVVSVTKKNSVYFVDTNDKQTFKSKYCICSVPLHLQNKILFDPPLPFQRTQLAMRSPMGSIIKITILYEKAFWRNKGLSGMSISLKYPTTYIIDASGKDGANPGLVCFLNGKYARDWSLLEEGTRKGLLIDQLVSIFGDEAKDYSDFIEQNWMNETFSSGCFFNIPSVGIFSRFGYILRAPHDNVHFAGTETSENWFGYMEGAIDSGYRCANEIMQKIQNAPKL